MNINDLLSQRDDLLNKIRNIEETCEGIDNENNAKKITNLNVKKSDLIAQKNNIANELKSIEHQLNNINKEINNISCTGIDRILEAIKQQRWYFFKNKPKVVMDKLTGILWANLNYFEWHKKNGFGYLREECTSIINTLNIDEYNKWELPTFEEFVNMIEDKTFPFQEGSNYSIKGVDCWYYDTSGTIESRINLDNLTVKYGDISAYILPCCRKLLYKDYNKDIVNFNIYKEKERLQFTLNLFTNNDLEPIFDNEEITELYRKIYIEKPALLEKLNELQGQINEVKQEVLLSSTFDYDNLLKKYDIKSIDNSLIKYYEAVKRWIDDLMNKMKYYENIKSELIRECNIIGLTLSKKYEDSPNLTDEENNLLKQRQNYFKKHFELGMNDISSKLLSIKKQAQNIEDRIDEINNGSDSIKELALLENESRASFRFIAENTANIIKNALTKIEYFEKNREFSTLAVKVWDEWTEDYKIFKTAKKEELKNISEDDGIEKEVWERWYNDWNNSRFIIEKQLLPLIERGLKGQIITNEANANKDIESDNIIKKLLELLKEYKNNVDEFYIEERKGIYQKFAFQVGGELQEKFEAESELFKITSRFEENLRELIFKVDKVEDRIFLIEWANNLTDLQINEILCFIRDKELCKISQDVLKEFSDLKRKNYEIFISDAKAYRQELVRREKEYNSLIFKMRKELMKQ